MRCVSNLLVLVLTWRSVVLGLQLELYEIRDISLCSTGVDTCEGSNFTFNQDIKYGGLRCFCDADCHLFGECCVDRAVHKENSRSADTDGSISDNKVQEEDLPSNSTRESGDSPDVRGEIQENTEVLGIPRDRWGCQKLMVSPTTILPVNTVRMVVRCPEDSRDDVSEKCTALNRSSSDFHYTMDIPVLSSISRIWYQNVYCSICNGDSASLEQLSYSVECEGNHTKEETLQVLRTGKYSTEPLHWIVEGTNKNLCRLRTELQPGASPGFIRPCGKTDGSNRSMLITESCPPHWTDVDVAKKCRAYAFYTRMGSNDTQSSAHDSSTVLSQVFKNPHCALCNGVPKLKRTCWLEFFADKTGRGKPRVPSFAIIMDFANFREENHQEYRACQPPDGVWDVLHGKCMQMNVDGSNRAGRMLNTTCPTIKLTKTEFRFLDNSSLQYTGDNSHYEGHVFDVFEIMKDGTAIICALQYDEETEDLISGAYQGYLTEFCLSISVICLILHVGTYCALPKLCNLPGKNLLSLSWTLLFAQMGFLIGINPAFEVAKEVCIGIAVVEYYCFLAAFLWMNVMSVDIWRTFSGSTLRGSGGLKTHRKYAGYAWGTSALLALVALIVDLCTEDGTVKPSFGIGQVCWFGSRGGLGLFLAMPLFVLLMVNSGLFANTVYKIWQARLHGARYIRDKTRAELIQTSSRNFTDLKENLNKRSVGSGITGRKDQIRFYLYLKLFIIMGLTWIFGFIAAFANVSFLWYPFIVFNGLQGAFIFVMFDVKRNIAYMLWDKYVSRHGYQPPGFLLASSSSSTTKTTDSSRSKSRDLAQTSDRTRPTAETRTISVSSNSHLASTVA